MENVKFCINCGNEIPRDSVFCPKCGADVKTDLVKELLEFYMGKNTMERQNFIIENLVIEEDIA